MLGRSACLRPESFAGQREVELGGEGERVDRMATVARRRVGGEACKTREEKREKLTWRGRTWSNSAFEEAARLGAQRPLAGLRLAVLISEATVRIGLTGRIGRWLTRERIEGCVFKTDMYVELAYEYKP